MTLGKFISVGVKSPTEINAPRGCAAAAYNANVASGRRRSLNVQSTFFLEVT